MDAGERLSQLASFEQKGAAYNRQARIRKGIMIAYHWHRLAWPMVALLLAHELSHISTAQPPVDPRRPSA